MRTRQKGGKARVGHPKVILKADCLDLIKQDFQRYSSHFKNISLFTLIHRAGKENQENKARRASQDER